MGPKIWPIDPTLEQLHIDTTTTTTTPPPNSTHHLKPSSNLPSSKNNLLFSLQKFQTISAQCPLNPNPRERERDRQLKKKKWGISEQEVSRGSSLWSVIAWKICQKNAFLWNKIHSTMVKQSLSRNPPGNASLLKRFMLPLMVFPQVIPNLFQVSKGFVFIVLCSKTSEPLMKVAKIESLYGLMLLNDELLSWVSRKFEYFLWGLFFF